MVPFFKRYSELKSLSIAPTVFLAIGIIENVEDFLRIYPNPTTGIVKIEPLNNHQIESIIITNEIGKTWEMKPVQNQLDLTGIPAGMYFLDISLISGDLVKTKLSLVK